MSGESGYHLEQTAARGSYSNGTTSASAEPILLAGFPEAEAPRLQPLACDPTKTPQNRKPQLISPPVTLFCSSELIQKSTSAFPRNNLKHLAEIE